MAGQQGPATPRSTKRVETSADSALAKSECRSIALDHEAKIHLCRRTLSRCHFHFDCFDWSSRSVGWTPYRFKVSQLWLEFGSQSPDRWQISRQPCTGSPLRSLYPSRTSCVDGFSRTKLQLVCADFDGAERSARPNLRVYSSLAGYGYCCSYSVSPPPGPVGVYWPFRIFDHCESGPVT